MSANSHFSLFFPFIWFTIFDRPGGLHTFPDQPAGSHQTNKTYSAHCSASAHSPFRTDLHARLKHQRNKRRKKKARFIFMPFRYFRGPVVWIYAKTTRVSSGQFLLGSSSSFSRAICTWGRLSLSLSLSVCSIYAFSLLPFPIFSLTWMMTMMSPPFSSPYQPYGQPATRKETFLR